MIYLETESVVLDDSLLIGKGRHRACYQHPHHSELCIKVHLDPRDIRETLREVKYFKKLHKKNAKLNSISDYIGTVKTNLGKGYVYQLIRDYDGEVSKTLSYYLSNNKYRDCLAESIKTAYLNFKKSLQNDAVAVMDLKAYNIVLKRVRENKFTLCLIDNIGTAALIPVTYYVELLCLKSLDRKFEKFEAMVERTYDIALSSL